MILSKSDYAAVSRCPLFSGLSDAETDAALRFFSAELRHYRKGETLCPAGNRLPGFGLVLSGIVQVFCDDLAGERVIMASVPPGNTFGESLCYLEVEDSPVWIISSAECDVLWLRCDTLRSVGDDPLERQIYRRFVTMLAERALSMNDRIQILSKLTIREKLLTYFSQCARAAGSRTFTVPLDRESLAAYLGVNRSALSRELSTMQRDGLIEFYKNSFKIL